MSFDPRVLPGVQQNPFAEKSPPPQADLNPYASPMYAQTPVYAAMQTGAQGGLWREGNVLVMHKKAPLPNICLLSNQPATARLKRSLRWHHPAVFLALFVNILVYAIVALMLSKTATIHIGISEEWRQRRIRRILVAWASILTGLGMFGLGIAFLAGRQTQEALGAGLLIAGIVVTFTGAIAGLIGAQLVSPKRITNDYVWLKGVHPAFLDRLPVWPYGQI